MPFGNRTDDPPPGRPATPTARAVDADVMYELGRWVITLATLLGTDVVDALGTFARDASEGSAFLLRCNGGGFEAQVSGPIVRGEPRLLSMEALATLARDLD
jgi:hypothetical protein